MVWLLRTSPVSWWMTVTVSASMRMVTGEPAWGCADAEVVHAAGAAEADLAEAVDVIGADSHRAGPGRRAAQCPRRPTPALDDHRQFRLDDPARRPPAPSEAASSHDLSSRSRVRWLLVRVGMNGAECLLRFHTSEDHDVDACST
jgi:hypothetical protein